MAQKRHTRLGFMIAATVFVHACSLPSTSIQKHHASDGPGSKGLDSKIESFCKNMANLKSDSDGKGESFADNFELCVGELSAKSINSASDLTNVDINDIIYIRMVDPGGVFSSPPGVKCTGLPAKHRTYLSIVQGEKELVALIAKRNSHAANALYKIYCKETEN